MQDHATWLDSHMMQALLAAAAAAQQRQAEDRSFHREQPRDVTKPDHLLSYLF